MENVLIVENLTIAFGQLLAVNSLSIEVREGEILGIIGPNGSGKTTLLNGISGLYKPKSGSVIFKDIDITDFSPSRRCRLGIGRTYQVPRTFEKMTVYENVLVGGVYGASLSEKKARYKVYEILELTGLLHKKDLFAGSLALLDRKRLEVARALATNPQLLLLDEVAAGLTEAEVNEVLRIVKYIKESGVTIIWIEHILRTMMEAADRVLCIASGKKLICGNPKEVLAAEEVQEVYLGVEEG
ncbi:ABC transporter ATP-binding protein [Moorella sulfitireducens]|uniref:ABC transporter ATP-binding protein n=1 Tax=Neomoorella sulfitireducens TaxID=2972948 RepID=UPI0021AC3880|nr:ABC transporter ATP-binding protein [Moorella sulfitireducens]